MASQEDEALHLMRAALAIPHGTAAERRHRLLEAWTFLRSSAVSQPVVDGALTAKEERKRLREEKRDQRKEKKRKLEVDSELRRGQPVEQDESEKSFLEAA